MIHRRAGRAEGNIPARAHNANAEAAGLFGNGNIAARLHIQRGAFFVECNSEPVVAHRNLQRPNGDGIAACVEHRRAIRVLERYLYEHVHGLIVRHFARTRGNDDRRQIAADNGRIEPYAEVRVERGLIARRLIACIEFFVHVDEVHHAVRALVDANRKQCRTNAVLRVERDVPAGNKAVRRPGEDAARERFQRYVSARGEYFANGDVAAVLTNRNVALIGDKRKSGTAANAQMERARRNVSIGIDRSDAVFKRVTIERFQILRGQKAAHQFAHRGHGVGANERCQRQTRGDFIHRINRLHDAANQNVRLCVQRVRQRLQQLFLGGDGWHGSGHERIERSGESLAEQRRHRCKIRQSRRSGVRHCPEDGRIDIAQVFPRSRALRNPGGDLFRRADTEQGFKELLVAVAHVDAC